MFLAPSRSDLSESLLITTLLGIFLREPDGKTPTAGAHHRDSRQRSTKKFDVIKLNSILPDEGCIADDPGGFNSHLTNSKELNASAATRQIVVEVVKNLGEIQLTKPEEIIKQESRISPILNYYATATPFSTPDDRATFFSKIIEAVARWHAALIHSRVKDGQTQRPDSNRLLHTHGKLPGRLPDFG